MLEQKELKRLFDYNPETGDLTWKVRPANRVHIGDKAASLNSAGYYGVVIKGKHYKVHRVIWCWVTGDDISDKCLDHINRIRTDNRWCNLRLATKLENRRNQITQGYCKRPYGTWRVRIRSLGKTLLDKTVKTEAEAIELIEKKRTEIFGAFKAA